MIFPGDTVDVRCVAFSGGKVVEEWHRAKVEMVKSRFVGVRFEDGSYLAAERGPGRFRRVLCDS